MKAQCVTLTVASIFGLLAFVGGANAQLGSPLAPVDLKEDTAQGAQVVRTPDGEEYAAGELIVTYKGEQARAKADKKGGKDQAEYDEFLDDNVEVLTFEDVKGKGIGALKEKKPQLEKSPGVESVELNPIGRPAYTPNDPYFNNGAQWYLKAMGAQEGWDFPYALGNPEPGTGHPVRIGIVDAGYDATHPEMCETYNPDTWFCKTGVKVVAQRDLSDGDNYARDSTGHGTMMASIASARTGNQRGLAGASPFAHLVVAKVVTDDQQTNCALVAAGINYAASKDAKVINVSYGLDGGCSPLKDAVDDAYDTGHTIVAAAGNWSSSESGECGPSIQTPAYYPKAIAVAGTDAKSAWANSCRGPEVDVAAQAANVVLAIPRYATASGQQPYGTTSGTSNSTALVSGLVANIISTSDVAPTQNEIRAALYNGADNIGTPGKDNATGHGRVNFYRSLKIAQAY